MYKHYLKKLKKFKKLFSKQKSSRKSFESTDEASTSAFDVSTFDTSTFDPQIHDLLVDMSTFKIQFQTKQATMNELAADDPKSLLLESVLNPGPLDAYVLQLPTDLFPGQIYAVLNLSGLEQMGMREQIHTGSITRIFVRIQS